MSPIRKQYQYSFPLISVTFILMWTLLRTLLVYSLPIHAGHVSSPPDSFDTPFKSVVRGGIEYIFIPDKKGAVRGTKNYAMATLPNDLFIIKESEMFDAGLGVFSKVQIPKNFLFGPYQGVIHDMKEADKVDVHYTWHVTSGDDEKLVDGNNPQESNWLRYVNHPLDNKRENMRPAILGDELYYATIRNIEPNEELLIWYGDAFHENLMEALLTVERERKLTENTQLGGRLSKFATCPTQNGQNSQAEFLHQTSDRLVKDLDEDKMDEHLRQFRLSMEGMSEFEKEYGFKKESKRKVSAASVEDCFELCEEDTTCEEATLIQKDGRGGDCYFVIEN